MEKQPFTTAGVNALQNWLNSLTDLQLQEQVLLMERDFTAWVMSHFELSARQLLSYNNLAAEVLSFVAWQSTFAVANRRPLHLITEYSIQRNNDDDGKLFKPKSSLALVAYNDGSFEVGGSFEIEVNYVN